VTTGIPTVASVDKACTTAQAQDAQDATEAMKLFPLTAVIAAAAPGIAAMAAAGAWNLCEASIGQSSHGSSAMNYFLN